MQRYVNKIFKTNMSERHLSKKYKKKFEKDFSFTTRVFSSKLIHYTHFFL